MLRELVAHKKMVSKGVRQERKTTVTLLVYIIRKTREFSAETMRELCQEHAPTMFEARLLRTYICMPRTRLQRVSL